MKALVTPFVGESRTDEALKLYWYSLEMVKKMFHTKGNQTSRDQFLKFRTCIQEFRLKGVDESLKEHYGVTSRELWELVSH